VVLLSSLLGRRTGAGLALAGLAALPLAASTAPTLLGSPAQAQSPPKRQEILLVSYAVTKAAYDKIIPQFTAEWKRKTGQTVSIRSSYGGSGSQTRAVIDGLDADVVGLALEGDVIKLEEAGLVKPGWQQELPNNGVATNSTIAIFTRKGNPKKIKTWKDLDNPNVEVVTANPKTSGGARWSFLSLWGAVTETGGKEADARKFILGVLKNVEVLPKDAREATDTFIKRGKGDVLLNWETEAILAKRTGEWTEGYQVPSPNILTEMPIAVVDKNVDKKGTRAVAEAFAKFLYTPTAQKLFVDNGFRPVTAEGKAYARGRFPALKTYTVKDFGGWKNVNKKFFGSGGIWDQVFSKAK
jgi:sulfate transport system substrate-binding protein